jgi:hypothetical protein
MTTYASDTSNTVCAKPRTRREILEDIAESLRRLADQGAPRQPYIPHIPHIRPIPTVPGPYWYRPTVCSSVSLTYDPHYWGAMTVFIGGKEVACVEVQPA